MNKLEHTLSAWEKDLSPLEFHPLVDDRECDVCVVGGGISGLTTAYFLAKAGRKVILLDKGRIGGGETGKTSAHLSNALDHRYSEIEKFHGELGARIAADSHTQAIDLFEEIVNEEHIKCELTRVPGQLCLSPSFDEKTLQQEFSAAERAGIHVEWNEHGNEDHFPFGPSILFKNQIQFHPMKYVYGLTRAIVKLGVQIYTSTLVSKVEGEADLTIYTGNGPKVFSREIVAATNSPFLDFITMHSKQAAYRTYVIGIETTDDTLPLGLYWDTESPYHYIRFETPSEGKRVLLIGGEDHKTGQLPDGREPWEELERWSRSQFPNLGKVVHRWSGQIEEPNDFLGFAGVNPGMHPNRYIVTGDAGNGLTHGTFGAKIITDLILGRENLWAEFYSPARVTYRAAPTFVRENANALFQYKDAFSANRHEIEDIPRGEGEIIRNHGKQLAVFRDKSGIIHSCSGTCPHLGATLRWNAMEKSWDCPAHGSRFNGEGKLLNGPANCDLKKATFIHTPAPELVAGLQIDTLGTSPA